MTSGDAIKLTTNGQKTAARSAPAALRARVLEGLLARLRRVRVAAVPGNGARRARFGRERDGARRVLRVHGCSPCS